MDLSGRHDARVLVHAPIGRDGPATAELLIRTGVTAEVCTSVHEVLDRIEEGAAAVFIAEEALFGTDMSRLAGWVEAQPPWSDLPFIVLTSRQEQPAIATWRQNLVRTLHNVSMLERPVQAITLTSTVQAGLRARQRQYELRKLLDAQEQAARGLEALITERTGALEEVNRELRRQMEERARIEESLRHAQKIEAIGQLTGGVAHDFNNLLMVIAGGLEMVDRQTDPVRRERIMEGMRNAAQRGAGLTKQLLAFSRRQPLKPEPVDIARQIGGMRELLDRSLRSNVHVSLEFGDDLWPVEVDPGELELVVLNLAVNARDAMPDGGTIVIRAINAPAGAEPDLAGDFVRLEVVDTGTGIAPEVKDRVFEPFFTTKGIGKGSGLGLAQVHGFAKQSGGSTRIESQPGAGTSIILSLPRSDRTPAADERNLIQFPPKAATASAGSVLLVEDDDEVATLVAEMLVELGYRVTRAACATAALGALSNGRPVDLVFSDIMMPGSMNGVELAREIHKRRPGLPLLLTSGYAEAAKMDADALGVRILPKPYQLQELASALGGVLDSGRMSSAG